MKRSFVATMRRRGQKDQVPRLVIGKQLEQFEPLLSALMRADAGMRFVHHDQRRTCTPEALAALFRLDIVEADHCVGVSMEQRLRRWKSAFQPRCGGGSDRHRIEVELGVQLAGPLFNEVRWTEDREAIGLAAINQLAEDQAGFNGLADADVVGDQQPHHVEAERHQQWHQLIGAWLETQPCGRAEGPGATPKR